MSADRVLFTGLPAILTLALHGGLVLMLVVRWTGPSEVIAAAPSIQPIQASLVQAETLEPKPKPSLNQAKPKPSQPQPSSRLSRNRPEPARSPNRGVESRSLRWMQSSWRLTRNELDSLVDAEIAAEGANEPSLRDVVAATIQASVINRWTRPPSARNGMVSILSIQLVPQARW